MKERQSRRSSNRRKKRVYVSKSTTRREVGGRAWIWNLAVVLTLTLTVLAVIRRDDRQKKLEFDLRDQIPVIGDYKAPEFDEISIQRPFFEFESGNLTPSPIGALRLAFDHESLVVRYAPLKTGGDAVAALPLPDPVGVDRAADYPTNQNLASRGEISFSTEMRRREAAPLGESKLARGDPAGGSGGPKGVPGTPGPTGGESGNDPFKGDPGIPTEPPGDKNESPRVSEHPFQGPDRLRPPMSSQVVPEPGTLALTGLGLLTLAGLSIRMRSP